MSILLATIPLMVAIIMLAVLQRNGLQRGLATMASAVAIALAIPSFRLAPDPLLVAVAQGAATSLTVLYVLFPALLLYQLQRITGGIGVLTSGIGRLCPDRDMQGRGGGYYVALGLGGVGGTMSETCSQF